MGRFGTHWHFSLITGNLILAAAIPGQPVLTHSIEELRRHALRPRFANCLIAKTHKRTLRPVADSS